MNKPLGMLDGPKEPLQYQVEFFQGGEFIENRIIHAYGLLHSKKLVHEICAECGYASFKIERLK